MGSSQQFRSYSALGALYFFWGTTYLAIRMALETFPPLVLISGRFLASGTLMLLLMKYNGAQLPRGRELWMTALYGIILLGGGNGALVYAETWIPSGLAALFITTGPFWLVGIEAALPGGERLHAPTLAGILVGFLGIIILVAPAATGAALGPNVLKGYLVLQLGCVLWSSAALLQRRLPTKAHPVVGGAVQQFATGVAVLPLALFAENHTIRWSERGVLAALWLVVFGSIVGYSAFVYVMERLPVSIVSTYNYVNPIVAVFLGWLFYREPFGWREAVAMLTVFAGVAMVKYYAPRAPSAKAEAVEA
jgi:drug/metabolite transporter (DMT)-like permease